MDSQGTATSPAFTGVRKSDRIRYGYSLRLIGTDQNGYEFEGDARTEVVTRDGGLLVTAFTLATGQKINLARADKKLEARVIGQCGIRDESNLYGFQFTEPAIGFWDVKFPELTEGSGVARLVLQCSRCSRQEVMHLGEIEMVVFENMHLIPHRCENCGNETLWNEPQIVGDNGVVVGSRAYDVRSQLLQPRRTSNDRKYTRISMKNAKACLHRKGFADDIVTVVDLSRGGVRFLSLVDYTPGAVVEVAVPYTAGGANVFTPGKIVRVKCRPTADIPGDFGLEYIKK